MVRIALAVLLLGACAPAHAGKPKKPKAPKSKELPPVEHKDFRVEGGVIREVSPVVLADSLKEEILVPPGVKGDSLPADSVDRILSRRAQRRMERALGDSTHTRYSYFFADTMPISRMSFISCVVPGFSQLHNKQYWKIPLAYATLGGAIYGFTVENKPYKDYRKQYDALVAAGAGHDQLDPVQTRMIEYNTRRQLFMAGIYISWVYFVADGAVNYPGAMSSVKKATTLSTILPGAGQVYNRSYWKVPVVLGGFATMGYMIDWNNRGYQRFKRAYDLVTDGNPDTVDEFGGRYSADFLQNLRNNYRRNRDLCIILTGAFYLLNIIDAHVDAQLKDYDISDDLSWRLEPSMMNFYSMQATRINMPALSLTIRF